MSKKHGKLDRYELLGISVVDDPLPGMELFLIKKGGPITKNLIGDPEVVDENSVDVDTNK